MRLICVRWYQASPASIRRRLHWRIRLWMYHRLANAGSLIIGGRLHVMWPMPWHASVKNDTVYTHGRPSGMLDFMGWYDRREAR